MCTYPSSSCAPRAEPNVGSRLASVARRYTVVPSLITWNLVRSNAPGWKTGEVGYWKVPGPWSSPVGSVTLRKLVPLVTSLVTVVCAYPVRLPDAVADTVSTLSPKPTGTVTENDPSGAATAVPVVDGVPVVVSRDSTTTFAPATVVPVTAVVGVVIAEPEAGAVSVTAIAPGGGLATYRWGVPDGASSARPP